MDEPEPQVTLEVVEATMSSPIFHAEATEPEMAADARHAPPPASAQISIGRRDGFEIVVVATAAVVASFLAADAHAAVLVGALGLAAGTFRRIDRHIPFSFGEGFVGYRPDPGWPHGVQEDDDVRWNWNAGRRRPPA